MIVNVSVTKTQVKGKGQRKRVKKSMTKTAFLRNWNELQSMISEIIATENVQYSCSIELLMDVLQSQMKTLFFIRIKTISTTTKQS